MINYIKIAFRNTMIISFGIGLLVGYCNLLYMVIKTNNDIAITVLLMGLIFVICLISEAIENKERR